MEQVNIHDAKTHFSKLLEKLASGSCDEIIIAKSGKPVAKLVPYQASADSRSLGLLADQVEYWESPDCWEPDQELTDSMINSTLFPDNTTHVDPEASVAEDEQDFQT